MTSPLTSADLTAEQKSQICGALSVGCDRQTAAHIVGCAVSDIRRAMQIDPKFIDEVLRAEARSELSHMRTIHDAAKDVKNWRASVWWLERHAPERFAARGAGQLNAPQLEAFITMLAEILSQHAQTSEERENLLARLKALAESVDQLLRDGVAANRLPSTGADRSPEPWAPNTDAEQAASEDMP